MKVPLLDLIHQYKSLKPSIDRAVIDVLESQQFILGASVSGLESQLGQYISNDYCLGVASGTDALLIALMAENIGPGDEVITSPYTFFATAGSIARTGATPVFVDIDPKSWQIDPAAIEAAITPQTKAIIPVHLYGQMADMYAITEIAGRHNLIIIEDAAQSLGARLDQRHAGTWGDYGCFSFFPSKNLGGAGDGGFISTNSGERFETLQKLRVHGSAPKYYHSLIGGNFRLDAIQAAVLSVKLPHLESWIAGRRKNASFYRHHFTEMGLVGSEHISLPEEIHGFHTYNQFAISVRPPHRDRLRQKLTDDGIGSEIYYPVPLHLQECFSYLNYRKGDFPASETAADSTLAIPIYPELTEEQMMHVIQSIASYFESAGKIC